MSYRGMDNSNYRNQMRPKGRAPFKQMNCDPMAQPVPRGRYMTMPGQQPQYPPTVGYPRNTPYPTIHSPEYGTVQYSQQITSAPPNWNSSVPMAMSEPYQMPAQHNYQPQQQVYNPETTHMIAIPSNAYIPQVQNASDFDPISNTCICSKCGFPNSLAHVTIKGLNEEIKRLREQINVEQQQLANANYDDGSSPTQQSTVQASSLSVDAQPFQMGGGQIHKSHQGVIESSDNSAEGTNRPHNPNGNEYPPRSAGDWARYDAGTPVVSASDMSTDQYTESPLDDDWNNPPEYADLQCAHSEPSEEPAPDRPDVVETPNVSANVWDQEPSNQERITVPSSSGSFIVSSGTHEDTNRDSEHNNSTPQNNEGRDTLKEDRNANEMQKNRPKEQRQKLNRPRGGRNDGYDNNRDSEGGRRFNNNRRESGGSNTSFHQRTASPQDQKDRRVEKRVPGSRDSSQSGAKSGPEHSEKNETDPADGGVKRFDSGDRSPSDKRVDSADRTFQRDSGDRFTRRGGGGGGRRFNESKGKGSDDTNWRATRDQDASDKRDDKRDDRRDGDRRDHFPRSGSRGGGGGGYRRSGTNMTFKVVVEKDGDLFSSPPDFSLAHCVAEDFRMGSGIAVNFRQNFKQVDELLDQRKRVGEVAVLEEKGRFIYYLISKRRSSGKPLWNDFVAAVEELARLCVEKGVKNLAMPKIGCGLDRLDWFQVKRLLEEVFTDKGVAVVVYNFEQNEESESPMKAKSTFYVVNQRKNLVDIDAETGLIFLCAEDASTTNRTIDSLEKKHKILYELRSMKKSTGEVLSITKGKEYLYGLVVRKNEREPLSYVNLGKCLRKLRNLNSKDRYGYFGLEAFRDDKDTLTMEKVLTLVRNVFGGVGYKLELYVCWPKDLEGDHVWDDMNSSSTTPSSK